MVQVASAAESVRMVGIGSKGARRLGLLVLSSTLAVSASPADSLHGRVQRLLEAGDTLLAIEVLQDPAEHAIDPAWTDALLDRLVLPDRSPRASAKPRSQAPPSWLLRLDGAHVSDSAGGAYQTGSLLVEHGWSLSRGRHQIVAGLRFDGFHGEEISIGAVMPRVGWLLAAGRHEALARTWVMLANDLDPDAGLDLAWRLHTHDAWWIGSRAALSRQGDQDVLVGTGLDQQIGSWVWSSSLEIGGQLVRLPMRYANRTIGIDSLVLSTVYVPGVSSYITIDNVDSLAWYDGEDPETITPYRLQMVGSAQLLWGSRAFRIGPGLRFEGRASLQEDTWIPGMRSFWPDGTTFLAPVGTPGELIPVSRDREIYPPATFKVGTYQDLHLNPSLITTFADPNRIWTMQAEAGWNFIFASNDGHPLEDTRSGLELRASSQVRW